MEEMVAVSELLGISIEDAARRTGICRSRVYDLVRSGKIDARKFGKRTIILAESLRFFLESLPSATEVKSARPKNHFEKRG